MQPAVEAQRQGRRYPLSELGCQFLLSCSPVGGCEEAQPWLPDPGIVHLGEEHRQQFRRHCRGSILEFRLQPGLVGFAVESRLIGLQCWPHLSDQRHLVGPESKVALASYGMAAERMAVERRLQSQ